MTIMDYRKYRGVPNALRECRERRGLTQDAVGRMLGLKDGTWVSRWESGEILPNLISAIKLAILLDAPVADLFPDIVSSIRSAIVHQPN